MTRIFTKSCLLQKPLLLIQLTLWPQALPTWLRANNPWANLSATQAAARPGTPSSTVEHHTLKFTHWVPHHWPKGPPLVMEPPQLATWQMRVPSPAMEPRISNRQQRGGKNGHFNQPQLSLQTTQWESRRIQETCQQLKKGGYGDITGEEQPLLPLLPQQAQMTIKHGRWLKAMVTSQGTPSCHGEGVQSMLLICWGCTRLLQLWVVWTSPEIEYGGHQTFT